MKNGHSGNGDNPYIQDTVDPQDPLLGGVLSQPLAARQRRAQHARGELHGWCSWNIHTKDGIVTWEMQALDYPTIDKEIPPYEPRGCQRGISYSWYLYSPLRVKYPYIRGALLDLWKEAKAAHEDPVDAWRALMSDPVKRARYQRARGKGGLRRASWETVKEIIAASAVHTIQEHGPTVSSASRRSRPCRCCPTRPAGACSS